MENHIHPPKRGKKEALSLGLGPKVDGAELTFSSEAPGWLFDCLQLASLLISQGLALLLVQYSAYQRWAEI